MAHWTSTSVSSRYAVYRPRYPQELFDRVISFVAPSVPKQLAIDIGCGTGQAVRGLATAFPRVIGVDPSATQVGAAWKPSGDEIKSFAAVDYIVGGAESFAFDAKDIGGKANLVTVAQALHWFDIPKFVDHITPLMAPQSVFATWNYQTCRVVPKPLGDAVDAMDKMLMDGGYWPRERRHVDDNYAQLVPLIEQSGVFKLKHQDQIMHSVKMTVPEAILYFSTWSGVGKHQAAHPEGPHVLQELEKVFVQHIPSADEKIELQFPINYFVFEFNKSTSSE